MQFLCVVFEFWDWQIENIFTLQKNESMNSEDLFLIKLCYYNKLSIFACMIFGTLMLKNWIL